MPHLKPICFFLASSVFHLDAAAQSHNKYQQQALMLKSVIELNHYQPRPIDDTFSRMLYNAFMERLDENHTYFLPVDLKELSAFATRLDDELNGNGWAFLNKCSSLYKSRLESADSLLANNHSNNSRHREIRKILDNGMGYDNYIAYLYFDALASAFDPHTQYMPPEEKQQFESQLSTQGYYFGFSLDRNSHDETEIVKLVPGSPAWRCGDLNKGDVLVKLAWEDSAPVDLTGSDPGEVSDLLSHTGSKLLHLTVRKANGLEKTVSLSREKIKNEENTVKGFILKGESRIGYIYLPDFYTSMNGSGGSCANDVAKEIVKLKKENMEGLILDLRFNGGGSLQEALDMAGIFIDEGPLTIIREKTGRPSALKDVNKGTIYDGPMVVLVNGQSASASELLSAVLQDYSRAVIVGSTTYGKGTAQVIMPVDTTGSANNVQEYGFVKVTTSKFYRVSGRTTQNTGVIPDVTLPDLFDALNYHESASPSALLADTVKRNPYYKPLPALPVAELAAKSGARVMSCKDFQAIRSYSKILSDSSVKNRPPLDLGLVKSTTYEAANNSFDKELISSDPYFLETNNRWIDRLDRDVYIAEGYNILHDLIGSKNTKQ